MASLTPKSSICCYVFKCFLFTDLKKNTLALTENLNFNGTYIGQKQPFERILKNGCSEQLFFWGGRCVFTNLNFICLFALDFCYTLSSGYCNCKFQRKARTRRTPSFKKTFALIFKKQSFSFNICVMSNTSVQSVFCKYINYIEVFSNESVSFVNQY